MSSPFCLLLISHSASLAFPFFNPPVSSCMASVQKLCYATRWLGYQLEETQIFFPLFYLGTAEWLVFKDKLKVKNQGSVILLLGHKDMQYVTLILWLKCHYNVDLTALLMGPYVSFHCLQLHLLSEPSIF